MLRGEFSPASLSQTESSSGRLLTRVAAGSCITATLLAGVLHVVTLTHAGGLWRDEAGGVQFAILLPLGEMCRNVAHDSFPVVFHLLVKAWSGLGLGGSDMGLRVLGFLAGLGLLGALWLNARLMGLGLPFVCLGLLATNVTVVLWGDSLRAYGCGCVFILLTLGLIWRLVRRPGLGSFLLAALAATLSVQTLYQNAFLVLAVCTAGSAVCARRRQWQAMSLVLGAGLAAAVSLVPYVPLMVEAQPWYQMAKMGFEFDRVWANLLSALGVPLGWPVWVWFGLLPLVFGSAFLSLGRPAKIGRVERGDLPVYAVLALVGGSAMFFVFLRLSELVTAPWYFLPLMVFAAGAMEAALAEWCWQFRLGAALFVIVMAGAPMPAALRFAKYRQTNADLVAAELKASARPGDFIVVAPFFNGISFARYFKGPAEWTTLPPFDDYRFYRADQLKERLCSKDLLGKVLNQVSNTLASGHTVWMVGDWPLPQPGETEPPELPPAPQPGETFGFAESSLCTYAWQRQAMFLIATRAEQALAVSVQPATPISQFEKLSLIRASGWRGEKTSLMPRQPGTAASEPQPAAVTK